MPLPNSAEARARQWLQRDIISGHSSGNPARRKPAYNVFSISAWNCRLPKLGKTRISAYRVDLWFQLARLCNLRLCFIESCSPKAHGRPPQIHMRRSVPQPLGPRCHVRCLETAGRAVGVKRRLRLGCYLSRGTCRDGRVPAMQKRRKLWAPATLYSTHSWSLAGCAVRPLRLRSTVDLRRGRGWQNPFHGEAGSGWPLWATIATGVVGRVPAISA